MSSSANLGNGSGTNTLIFGGGSLYTTAGFTNARNITLNDDGTLTSASGTAVYTGTINGGNDLFLNGSITLAPRKLQV